MSIRCRSDDRRMGSGYRSGVMRMRAAGHVATFGFLGLCAAGGTLAGAGQPPPPTQGGIGQTPSPLPLTQSVRERGSSVTPAFEGWYYDKDGSIRLLVGYFNRNTKQ